MSLSEAKRYLELCDRQECRDHYFGDREVYWTFMGIEVAGGYFGHDGHQVWIYKFDTQEELVIFNSEEADILVKVGKTAVVERNDMQGNEYPFERYRGA